MQVTFIGLVVCFVLSVGLLTEAQPGRDENPKPPELPNCQALHGNITPAADEDEQLAKEKDVTLSRVAAIGAGECEVQRRSIYIYRYLTINGQTVRCSARISFWSSCQGYCRSYQYLNPSSGYASKNCACCQATRLQTATQTVTLNCGNCVYLSYPHTYIQPASCNCRSC